MQKFPFPSSSLFQRQIDLEERRKVMIADLFNCNDEHKIDVKQKRGRSYRPFNFNKSDNDSLKLNNNNNNIKYMVLIFDNYGFGNESLENEIINNTKNKNENTSILYNYYYYVISRKSIKTSTDCNEDLSLLKLETELIRYVFSNDICIKFQDKYTNIVVKEIDK